MDFLEVVSSEKKWFLRRRSGVFEVAVRLGLSEWRYSIRKGALSSFSGEMPFFS
jgi:hypothetical protein